MAPLWGQGEDGGILDLLEDDIGLVEVGEDWKLSEEGVYLLEEVEVVGEYVEEAVEKEPEPIVVEEVEVDEEELLFGTASTSTLDGAELQRAIRGTLGDTLAGQPGVSASSYSAGASRPIIRGLDGFRVATLLDGLGTLDLSQDSPDHGVAVDPAQAKAIEIYRGPSALRFGSGAIGGAVNTVTRLRPELVPEGEIATLFSAGYNSQGNGTQFGIGAKVADGAWAFNIYNGERRAGDLSIPGNAWTDDYIRIVRPRVQTNDGNVILLDSPEGTLENSFSESESRSLGVTFGSPDTFQLGVSVSQFNSDYGIPFFFDLTETGRPFGQSSISTELTRLDSELLVVPEEPWGPFSKLSFRFASGQYDHVESFEGLNLGDLVLDEGTDSVSIIFDRESTEVRLELHNGGEDSFLKGVSGVNLALNRLFSRRFVPLIEGSDDALLRQESSGFYTTQKLTWGDWSLEAGLRGEFGTVSSQTTGFIEEETSTLSQALTLNWETDRIPGLVNFGAHFTASLTERAPSVVERYAFWNNEALGLLVIGGDFGSLFVRDIEGPLEIEKARHLELSVTADWGWGNALFTAYETDFDNFIFLEQQANLGFGATAIYVGREALIRGLEGKAQFSLWESSGSDRKLELEVAGDWVTGQDLTLNDELPRLPAPKLGTTLTYQSSNWDAYIELRRSFGSGSTRQLPVPEFPTDPYTLLNAGITWRSDWLGSSFEMSLRGTNLLNEEIREHTSFRKDTSPQPGRGVSVEARWQF